MTFDSKEGEICVDFDARLSLRELQTVSSRRPQMELQRSKLANNVNFNSDDYAISIDRRMDNYHDSRRSVGRTKSNRNNASSVKSNNNASFSIPDLVESDSAGWEQSCGESAWSSSKMSSSINMLESARQFSSSMHSLDNFASPVSHGEAKQGRNNNLVRIPSTNSIGLSDIEDNSQEGDWENSLTYCVIDENDDKNKKMDRDSPSPKSTTEFDSSYKYDRQFGNYINDDRPLGIEISSPSRFHTPKRNNLRHLKLQRVYKMMAQNEDNFTRQGNASMNWFDLVNDNTRPRRNQKDLSASYTMQEDLLNYYRQRRQQELSEKMSRSYCANFDRNANKLHQNNDGHNRVYEGSSSVPSLQTSPMFHRQSSFRALAEAEARALIDGGIEAIRSMKYNFTSDSTISLEEDLASHDNITMETIEVSPGVNLRLRGAKETMAAIEKQFYVECACVCCEMSLYCIQDAAFVLCPDCKTISPTVENADNDSEHDGGVGLGFKDVDMKEII